MKGHFTPHTEESKEKMRVANLGKRYSRATEFTSERTNGKKNRNYKDGRALNFKEYQKQWQIENHHRLLAAAKRWREKHPEKARAIMVEWRKKNRGYTNRYTKRRVKTDIQFRLAILLRSRLHMALKGKSKSAPTLELLGCPVSQLKEHLEKQFKEGMTWENHGLQGWHIDHIKPFASFDLTDPEQQRRVCHYTNLQPLWAAENRRKYAHV